MRWLGGLPHVLDVLLGLGLPKSQTDFSKGDGDAVYDGDGHVHDCGCSFIISLLYN